jgi:hypothetical protein
MWNLPSFYTCISRNYDESKMQLMNNGCNTSKMNDSTKVQLLLIVQEMWKKSLTYSSINVKHYVVVCVLIYTNKCNMQHLNNGFN